MILHDIMPFGCSGASAFAAFAVASFVLSRLGNGSSLLVFSSSSERL